MAVKKAAKKVARTGGAEAERAEESAAIPAAKAGKRILLVDGGVWFPPGRIHRQRLLVASSGCDAAILVVRSGHAPPAAWSTSLEAIGVEPLGEVISFVPASPIA